MKGIDAYIEYSDDDIVIVNKPPNLLSIPDRYDNKKKNVKSLLESRFDNVFTVHRLDFQTSGLICFALNKEAHKKLNQQFEKGEVTKIYHAILKGRPQPKEGLIDYPIATHPVKKGLMRCYSKGKHAETMYKVEKQFKDYALVKINLLTGRTHQIRVHFGKIGFPLAVDKDYGFEDAFFLSSIKRKYRVGKHIDERPLIERVTLHSSQMQFIHPSTNEEVTFEIELPKDLKAMLNQLKKNN